MQDSEGPKTRISLALVKLLKPLARLLIKFEISYSEFSEITKQAFAEAAYDYYKLPKKKMTFARVAVLTGLSRKQVIRLLSENNSNMPVPKISQSRTSRVILGWISDKDFCTGKTPNTLALRGAGNTFAKLVERYSGDMSPRSVLDEMVLSKLVRINDDNEVTLINSGGKPPDEDIEKFRVLATSTGDLLHTGVHNLLSQESEALRFQREYIRNNVPDDLIEEFKEYSDSKSQELLADYVNWIRQKSNESPSKARPGKRIGIGIYYFQEDNEENKEDKS